MTTKLVTQLTIDTEFNGDFPFLKDHMKVKKLIEANGLLNINRHTNNHNKILFVYSAPKVGSTSIVSSFRLFALDKIDIIHIHDEEMLNVLTKIKDITINELILFNSYLGKEVYVLNIYRSPIERKISTFFEKIGSHHFNAEDSEVNRYNVAKVIERFNNIFPWIGVGDHFIDNYCISVPECFDFEKKYLLVVQNNVKYISLRLKDSNNWGDILTNIFGFTIKTIKDYESTKKAIKDLYISFKNEYKIPINLLEDVMQDKYLNYYYSPDELAEYYNTWFQKSGDSRVAYTLDEYKLYTSISIENCHIDKIQLDHYFDEGCICRACNLKRNETVAKIMKGIEVKDRIVHLEAKSELLYKRASKINDFISAISPQNSRKNFKKDMKSVVSKSFGKY